MKRAVVYLVFILFGTVSYGQNSGIDIKYVHSEGGKEWKRMYRPDGKQVHESLEDDIFIFYSNGTFKYDHSGTLNNELSNAKTKTWAYDNQTNILTWEFYLSNGSTKKYAAELTYVDDKRVVMNLSEDGKEPHIVVFIAN